MALDKEIEMDLPGMITLHKWITDECRKHKTTVGACDEVLSDMKHELAAVYDGWPIGLGVRVHVVVSVERPTSDG